MRKFDYSFLDNGNLPASIVNTIGGIYAWRTSTDARKEEHAQLFTALEKVAKVQSVKTSNAIEGIVASDQRIKEIVNQNSAPRDHDEEEIEGYRDALNKVHTEYDHLNFREKDILLLHETMMTPAKDPLAGKYKQTDNVIVEIDSQGYRTVRFRPVSAEETKAHMEQLELAYLDACSNYHINSLLLIPCVILDFLCIHPFMDGNGRISRLLSLLLMYKNGLDVGKYISFEAQINKYKRSYYEALQKSSAGWDENKNDYVPFMENFLFSLYMCYSELDKRFSIVKGKKFTKENRVEATVLDSISPLSKADICEINPDISPTTVELVLGKLLKAGKIQKIGSASYTQYVKKY